MKYIDNLTGGFVGVSLWSCVEMNVAVMSACLPTVRPLLSNVPVHLNKIRPYTTGGRLWPRNSYNEARRGGGTDAEELSRLPSDAISQFSVLNEVVSCRSDIESTKDNQSERVIF